MVHPQSIKDTVGKDALKEAVLEAILPYMTNTGGVRLEHNAFQHIAATAAS